MTHTQDGDTKVPHPHVLKDDNYIPRKLYHTNWSVKVNWQKNLWHTNWPVKVN